MSYLEMAKRKMAEIKSRRALVPVELPVEWHDFYLERIAVMVEDGKQPLEVAERQAMLDTLAIIRRHREQ